MFCTRCGDELRDTDRYCSKCGHATNLVGAALGTNLTSRTLTRSMEDKKIAGVCAGFARYLGADVTLVRVLWLTFAVLTGIGFILYLVGWIAMPKDYVAAGHLTQQATNPPAY